MNAESLIKYVTKFKPQHDLWRYALAELGIGGAATTAGLLTANRMKATFVKAGVAAAKPKFGPPQFVAGLAILQAAAEFSKAPLSPEPPSIVVTPEIAFFTSRVELVTTERVSYLVTLMFALADWKVRTGRADADNLIDEIYTALNTNPLLTRTFRRWDNDEDMEREEADLRYLMGRRIPICLPRIARSSEQKELAEWGNRQLAELQIKPILWRWLGVSIGGAYPKLALKLTSYGVLLPQILNMAEDDLVDIAIKLGGKAFSAVQAFIEELLHWRVVRESKEAAFWFDILEPVRSFQISWTQPGAADAVLV